MYPCMYKNFGGVDVRATDCGEEVGGCLQCMNILTNSEARFRWRTFQCARPNQIKYGTCLTTNLDIRKFSTKLLVYHNNMIMHVKTNYALKFGA
jgi:hypothetical protein